MNPIPRGLYHQSSLAHLSVMQGSDLLMILLLKGLKPDNTEEGRLAAKRFCRD